MKSFELIILTCFNLNAQWLLDNVMLSHCYTYYTYTYIHTYNSILIQINFATNLYFFCFHFSYEFVHKIGDLFICDCRETHPSIMLQKTTNPLSPPGFFSWNWVNTIYFFFQIWLWLTAHYNFNIIIIKVRKDESFWWRVPRWERTNRNNS